MLHEIGAHYTYSGVPYDRWWQELFGTTMHELLGWQRNQFDRLVHFTYGLTITLPAFELISARMAPRGAWRYVLAATFMMSHSLIYELIEWGAAILFGGELGTAYLGTQGDAWDAQKDMALAALGTSVTTVSIAMHEWQLNAGDSASASAVPSPPSGCPPVRRW